MRDPKIDEYKSWLKEKYEDHKSDISLWAPIVGGFAVWAIYMYGVKHGKIIASHGPCIEVGRKGADLLLAGKALAIRVDGRDVLYKVLPD